MALILALSLGAAMASESDTNVIVNGMPLEFPGQGPIVSSGHTLIPARAVFEALGYNIMWEESAQRVIAYGYAQIIIIDIGGNYFIVNGASHPLEHPAQLIGNRALMPMYSILPRLGFTVSHDINGIFTVSDSGIRPGMPFTFAAGRSASFAIDPSGNLHGWGHHSMLPTPDITENHPYPTPLMENVIAVYANAQGDHAAAITADGGLWLWGRNNAGQIGDGTRTTYSGYHEDFLNYIAGDFYGTDVEFDESWLNQVQEDNDRHTPVRVMDNVASVALGTWHSMAIKTDGSLWVWGGHDFHYHNARSTSPVHVMDDVIAVSAGLFHTLALRSNGELWVWGINFAGVITQETARNNFEHIPPMKVMEDIITISAATFHSMAITSSGELWGWGENNWGQLGDNTWQHRHFPIHIMDNVVSVATYAYGTMVITKDGRLLEWGEQLASNYDEERDGHLLAPRLIMESALAVDMSYTHSMAIQKDGSLWAWGGNNVSGQIGDGTISDIIYVNGRWEWSPDNRRPYPVMVMNEVLR